MTDGSQAVVWDAWYWPYGEARAITGTATLNMRAPGQYFLAESGTMSNWHRQYDPTLGRYLQPDPVADVLATRPVNLDGSTLAARGGISGGSQLASPTAAAAAASTRTRSGIGNELPAFIDGPSVYQFARSMPAMYVDPMGLDTTVWINTRGGRSVRMGPTNGNWGGKCWSGGQYSCGSAGIGNLGPTDSGDACYKQHDLCYAGCSDKYCFSRCNRALMDDLRRLGPDPTKWPVPPRRGSLEDTIRFRDGAILLWGRGD